MDVACSIFTLDGGFQLFWTGFDLFFTVAPLTLGSGAPLVVKIDTKALKNAVFVVFLYLDSNISITVCLIWLCKVPKEESRLANFNGTHKFGVRCPSGGENVYQSNY